MNTTYYERYSKGEEIAVWNDLRKLENITPANESWGDITDVMKESMRRIKFNIDTIYGRLQSAHYKFKNNFHRELPNNDVEIKLTRLKGRLNSLGYYIPLTLEYFYRIVGSVDFTHTFDNYYVKGNESAMLPVKDNFTYEYADPLCIASIEDMLELMGEEGEWEENMEDYTDSGENPYVDIAPDYYHKDNVSGGAPYAVEVTRTPLVDSLFMNTPYGNGIYFIDYLRLCFEWGGFPNIAANNENYKEFIDKLKGGLMTI